MLSLLLKMNKRLLAIFIFFLSLFLISKMFGIHEKISWSYIHGLLMENKFISIVSYIVLFVFGNLVQIPGWVFLGGAVLALGKFYGGLLTFLSALVSITVTFFIAKFIGKDALTKIKSNYVKNLISKVNESPLKNMIIIRIIVQVFPPVNVALALSGVSFSKYFIAVLIGLPIPLLGYCYMFEELFRYMK